MLELGILSNFEEIMNQSTVSGLKKAYDTYINEVVNNFHSSIGAAKEEIETCSIHNSERNSPQDNALRSLLLEIHNDSMMADFLNYRLIHSFHTINHGYTTGSVEFHLGFLSRNGKVNYHYNWNNHLRYYSAEEDKKLTIEQESQFLLEDGRFYYCEKYNPDNKKELIDIFPNLTVAKLELSFNKLIEEEKNRRIKQKQDESLIT